MKKIYLAGGCFWGVEEYFSNIKGVISTRVGFANGFKPNPTYKEICETETGYVEACELLYDSETTSLENILAYMFKIIDPTSINKQGNDVGTQYRTGIYYKTDDIESHDMAIKFIQNQQKNYTDKIVVEVEQLTTFFLAKEEHQKYLKKNPNGYCHIPQKLIDELK